MKTTMKWGYILIGIVVCVGWMTVQKVQAEEKNEDTVSQTQEQILAEFDFGDVNEMLSDIFPERRLDFGEMLGQLIRGEKECSVKLLTEIVKEKLFYEIRGNKRNLVQILLIAIIAAVFTNFSGVFRNQQSSETSFYLLYLLLMTLCLSSFRMMIETVGNQLKTLLTFMGVLGPVYFLGVAFAAGSVSAVAFYNFVLFLIFLVELIILNFTIPMIQVYMMVKFLNNLSWEDHLSKLAELLEMVIVWTLKTLLACVIGFNVLQGLLSPTIDSLKQSVLTKGAGAIPGIGNALGGVAEVVLGAAVLIKNGIGILGAIICITICLGPLLQVAVMTFMYKLAAALLQPISDKRIVGCISGMGEGCRLLLRAVFTTGVLFLLTIAVVAATTTK
ncbi:MAG: stage III sporulation protein AE [Lachnospiraceae bacterium]